MTGPPFSHPRLAPRPIDETVETLRARLDAHRERPEPAVTLAAFRPAVQPPAEETALVLALDGAAVALRLRDGRVFVGSIVARHAAAVVLRLWGDRTVRLARSAIASARVVGEHAWRDAREVARRQRRGEPALVADPERRGPRVQEE